MLRLGRVLTTAEVGELDTIEQIVKLSEWIDRKMPAENAEAKRKILDAFRKGAKEARLQQAENDGNLVPLAWNQGGHRILYTMHDEEMLNEVAQGLRPRFEAMISWYKRMVNPAPKMRQVKMDMFVKRKSNPLGDATRV